MTDTYQTGVTIVIGFVFFALILISLIELGLELFDLPSISHRVEKWSIESEWFAGAFILLVAVLLAHFFLNPLHPPDASSVPRA